MPAKKTVKKTGPAASMKIAKSAHHARSAWHAKPARHSAPRPLIAEMPKEFPTKYVVIGLLLFIFIAWLIVAIVRVNNSADSGTRVYNEQAAVDPACNKDPLITVPNCVNLKN